jgi:hypothetical protein
MCLGDGCKVVLKGQDLRQRVNTQLNKPWIGGAHGNHAGEYSPQCSNPLSNHPLRVMCATPGGIPGRKTFGTVAWFTNTSVRCPSCPRGIHSEDRFRKVHGEFATLTPQHTSISVPPVYKVNSCEQGCLCMQAKWPYHPTRCTIDRFEVSNRLSGTMLCLCRRCTVVTRMGEVISMGID